MIFIGAVLFYAAANLNSIIAERRQTILDKVSASLGRPVHAADIKASLGWGIMADITGVQVGDDPAISDKPFIEASNVYAKLHLIPLLARQIEVAEVVLDKPVIRIVQGRDGTYNVSTIGRNRREQTREAEAKGPKTLTETAKGGSSALGRLQVRDFTINDGTVIYQAPGAPTGVSINAIDVAVRDFDFISAFTVAITFAAASDKQNFDLSATVGPLIKNGEIDVDAIPLSVKATVGPILLSQLKEVSILAKSIPPKLAIADGVSFEASADGTTGVLKFNVSSDLGANAITFGDAFNKPAGLPLKISAQGARTGSAVGVSLANVALDDLAMKATDIKVGGGTTSARVDTNSFDLASLAKVIPALGKYTLSGKSEIHSDVTIADGKPSAHGTVSLADVGLSEPDQKAPPLSHLSGNVKLAGTGADVGPLTFNLGAAQATLSSQVDRFQPLSASYKLSTASIHPADFAPSRPADEQVNQLLAKGSVSIQPIGPMVDSQITSASGNLANVAYQDLNLSISIEGKRARVISLKLKAFSGDIAATGESRLEPAAPFNASISFTNLDIKQMLDAQKAKAAGTLRGTLGGNMNVSARGGSFEDMKPTMKGAGRLELTNGKLIGVNIGGEALKKVQNLPAIGNLVPAPVVQNHPELFSNPDTDIQTASLSYVLAGPRITSHDIKVQTVDYNLLGDGWFDMDKNIDMAARIVLSPQFSKELIEQKQQVSFVANRDGQIDIPLQISGQLPKPSILPDVTELAQRAGQHAVQAQGQKYLGKVFGKKGLPGGLGKFFGTDSSGGSDSGAGDGSGSAGSGGGAPAGGGSNPPPNPLDQLKKLF